MNRNLNEKSSGSVNMDDPIIVDMSDEEFRVIKLSADELNLSVEDFLRISALYPDDDTAFFNARIDILSNETELAFQVLSEIFKKNDDPEFSDELIGISERIKLYLSKLRK